MKRNIRTDGLVVSLLNGAGVHPLLSPVVRSMVVGGLLTLFLSWVLKGCMNVVGDHPFSLFLPAAGEVLMMFVWVPAFMLLSVGIKESYTVYKGL